MCTGSRWQNVKKNCKDLDQRSLKYTVIYFINPIGDQITYYNSILNISNKNFYNICN